MGFVYATSPTTGRQVLSCDFCGDFKGYNNTKWVRKMACPYGYCQAWATCDKCAKLGKHKERASCGFDGDLNKNHAGCKIGMEESRKKDLHEQELLNAGKFIRRAALGHDEPNRVKVIFKGRAGERAFFMSYETYRAISIGETSTVEDFAAIGPLVECVNTEIYVNA